MEKKHIMATVASALVAVSSISGITASAATTGAKPVTITWYTEPMNPGTSATLAKDFEKLHPNIHINLEIGPTDTDTMRTTLSTTISGGSATPDVYEGDVIWPAQFAQDNLALDMSKELPKRFWNRFKPGLVRGATYQGQVYGVPFAMDEGFMYYRKDLLKKAHLPVPKTWAQLQQDSLRLVHDHLVKYGYVWQGDSYEGLTCDFTEVLADAGGAVLNSGDSQSALNTPQALKAFNFMRGLITSGASPAAVTTFQEPQAMNTFEAGNAAFLRNWGYAWADANNKQSSKVAGDVGIEPMPTFSASGFPGYSCIGGANLYINPHSAHLAEDLTFIQWLTGNQAQTILASFNHYPVNAAVEASPKVIAMSPVMSMLHQTKVATRPSETPNYTSVSQALFTNLNAALSGSVSTQQALRKADASINQAVSKNSL